MTTPLIVRYLWLSLGWVSIGLGIIGAFLPLLPTTPFLLLAAFSFSRGSANVHKWLVNHPTFGPPIHNWHQHRAISRRAKWAGTLSLVIVLAISVVLQIAWWAITVQGFVLVGVAVFLWTRNELPATPAREEN